MELTLCRNDELDFEGRTHRSREPGRKIIVAGGVVFNSSFAASLPSKHSYLCMNACQSCRVGVLSGFDFPSLKGINGHSVLSQFLKQGTHTI